MTGLARSPRHGRGYTLVELLVGATIMTVVLTVAFRFMAHMNQVAPNISERLALQMEARKAADSMVNLVRESTEIVKPSLGESRPYLVYKDTLNYTTVLYLIKDDKSSKTCKKNLYKLVQYRDEYTGKYEPGNEKVLFEAVERLTFTCLSPMNVLANVTVANEKGNYQFITFLGVMNLGGLE